MTADSGPPILELYGGVRRRLYRPGWAAFGCAALALAFAIQVLGAHLFPYVAHFLPGSIGALAIVRICEVVAVVATVLMGLGVLGLWVGNLAHDSVSEWPRAMMAMAGWIAVGIDLVLDGIWIITTDSRSAGSAFADFQNLLVPLGLMASLFKVVAIAFAIVYTLQLAAWLGKRRLAHWSMAILGFYLAVTGALLLVIATELAILWLHLFTAAESIVYLSARIVVLGNLIASVLLAVYFGVIAIRLWRWPAVT